MSISNDNVGECHHPFGPCDVCLFKPGERQRIGERALLEQSYIDQDGEYTFAGVEHP